MKVIKAILSFLGIGAGGFSIYASYIMKQMECGSTEWDMMYGGDAYTGIQNAAAQAANNVKDFAELVRDGFAIAFFVMGLLTILYFGIKFFEVLGEKKIKNVTPTVAKIEYEEGSFADKMDEEVVENEEVDREEIEKTE